MRPLDLELLRTFVAVAEREGFAAAAGHIHRTQSAVTQQMARLEAQLGVALFRKVGRSKRLTEHGVRLLDYAHRLLALNDEAVESLAAPDLRGPLRIGSVHDATDFLLAPLLARFRLLYPNLQIEVHPDRTAHLMQALKRGDIEIALTGRLHGEADPAHRSVTLRSSPLVWLAGAKYVHDLKLPVPLVLPNEPSSYRAAAVASLDRHGTRWRIRHVSTSLAFDSLRAALRAGLGITVRIIEMLSHDLRVLTEEDGLPPLPNMTLDLYLRDESVSQPARRLFEAMRDIARQPPLQARSAPARLRQTRRP